METSQIPHNWTIEEREDGIAVWDSQNNARCAAKTQSGKACKKRPIKGRYRCATHNGNAARGELHHSYKHGGFSQFAPKSLRERMQILSGGELLDLSSNKLLIDARLSELVEHLEGDDFSHSAQKLRAQYRKVKKSHEDGKKEQFLRQFESLGQMIEATADDYETWDEILKWNTASQNMAQSIHKMTLDNDGMVSAVQAFNVIIRMADLFMEVNKLKDERDRERVFRSGASEIISLPTSGQE